MMLAAASKLCNIQQNTRALSSQARRKRLAYDQLPIVSGRYTAGGGSDHFRTLGHSFGNFMPQAQSRSSLAGVFALLPHTRAQLVRAKLRLRRTAAA
jgi:uncharacterized protein (DUF2126 family)